MAGETWQVPKTDWVFGEAVPTTWLNKIEGNLVVEHRGGGYIVPVTIAPDVLGLLDIGETNDTFLVSDDGTVSYITTAGRQFGNKINLIKTGGTGSLQYGAGNAPSGALPIYANSSGDSSTSAWYTGRLYTLVLGVAAWHHDTYIMSA